MKRLNPETGLEFVRGDIRDDGYIFTRYLTDRQIKKDGFYREGWSSPKRLNYGKTRLNPATGNTFYRGEYNQDKTKRFWGYVSKSSDKNGFCYEDWYDLEQFSSAMARQRKHSNNKKNKIKNLVAEGKIKRRLNPITGEEFREGDRNENGLIFFTYVGQERTKDGFVGEYWGNKQQFHRRKLSSTRFRAQKRARELGLEFDLTLECLEELFPIDSICPVFGVKMEWNGSILSSPSLDRIVPDLGYVKNNVAFICGRANTLKLDRTPDVLRKIAKYVEFQIAKAVDI